MLSFKRLCYILAIVLGISLMFLVFSINEENNKLVSIGRTDVADEETETGHSISADSKIRFIVTGDENKATYKDIYSNVCIMLDDMKMCWRKTDYIQDDMLDDENTVIVFCDEEISRYIDLKSYVRYIENGGKSILAAGITSGNENSYLSAVLGIVEKSQKLQTEDFMFVGDFFPLQEERMHYSGFCSSTWLKQTRDADVYVEDAKSHTPLVYTYNYKKGSTLMINSTILADMKCMGILTSGIAALIDNFVYPVLGAECVYLDNFPVVTYIDDKSCMKLYGRTTESFVKEVIWPVFQKIAVADSVRYTCSVITVASDNSMFQPITQELFYTMGKSALQFDGEMAYAVSCDDEDKIYLNRNFTEGFQQTFINYDISSVVMMTKGPVSGAIDKIGGKIGAVRGKISSDTDEERLMYGDDYYVIPELTAGSSLDEGNMLEISSMLSAYGMVSHTFDVNSLICTGPNQPTWDEKKKELGQFSDRVFKETDYLERYTLSQMKNRVKSYEGVEYSWKRDGNTMKINVNNFVKGQTFFMKSREDVKSVSGGEYKRLNNGYYMISVQSPNVEIEF